MWWTTEIGLKGVVYLPPLSPRYNPVEYVFSSWIEYAGFGYKPAETEKRPCDSNSSQRKGWRDTQAISGIWRERRRQATHSAWVVLRKRREPRRRDLVKWKGYDEQDANWEPQSHLKHGAQQAIKDFELIEQRIQRRTGEYEVEAILAGRTQRTWRTLRNWCRSLKKRKTAERVRLFFPWWLILDLSAKKIHQRTPQGAVNQVKCNCENHGFVYTLENDKAKRQHQRLSPRQCGALLPGLHVLEGPGLRRRFYSSCM